MKNLFSVHLVDIWNIIESFRENGLNAVEYSAEVKVSRMELLLSTVYHNLNKRLPHAQQIDTDKSIGLLLCFLLGAYDRSVSVPPPSRILYLNKWIPLVRMLADCASSLSKWRSQLCVQENCWINFDVMGSNCGKHK